MDKRFASLFGYFVAIAVVSAAVLAVIPWMPDRISKEATSVDNLFYGFLVLSVVIFSIVGAMVLYSVRNFKAEPGDMSDGEPIYGSHKLELIWSIIPAVIVIAISAISFWVMVENEKKPAAGTSMVVNVSAFQFGWSYDYPEFQIREATNLVLPISKTILFKVQAVGGTKVAADKQDVMHAFWVPESRLKIDAVPGVPTKTQWTPNKITGPEDRPQVVCAELCGSGHNSMRSDMCITSAKTFDFWKSHTDLSCAQLKLMTCWPDESVMTAATAAVAVVTKNPDVDSCKSVLAAADKLSTAELEAAALIIEPAPEEEAEADPVVAPASETDPETTNTEELAAA